jgi:hypothetical protein
MSAPIHPRDAAEQLHLGPERVDQPPDLVGEAADRLVEVVELGQDLAHDKGVMGPEPPLQRLPEERDLAAQAAPGEVGEDVGVAGAADQGVKDGPAGDPEDVGGHRGELEASILEHPIQALGLAAQLLDLDLAVTGEVAEVADRLGGHEAGSDQAVLDELGDPRRVGDVGLALGDVAHVACVEQPALEVVLEHVVVGSSRGAV